MRSTFLFQTRIKPKTIHTGPYSLGGGTAGSYIPSPHGGPWLTLEENGFPSKLENHTFSSSCAIGLRGVHGGKVCYLMLQWSGRRPAKTALTGLCTPSMAQYLNNVE